MDHSDHESIIPEQQHIHIAVSPNKEEKEINAPYKYATVNQIKSFERASELHNQQLIQNRPLLFGEDDFAESSLHFISDKGKESFKKGNKTESSIGILQTKEDDFTLKLPISNIKRQNTLIMNIKNLKRRFPLQLLNVQTQKEKQQVRYKYILLLNQINLVVRVLVNLGGEFKVWKQMEVPLTENRFSLQIHEFNNEQTDIKINNFLFHLILKMPYHEESNYCFIHHNKADIEKVQFMSKSDKRIVQTNETYCTKDCQLI